MRDKGLQSITVKEKIKMTLANRVTFFRFILLPLFILSLSIGGYWANLLALMIVGIAALTDLYDGWVARSHKAETVWGKLMDPLADKLLAISAFIFFVEIDLGIPAWMVVLIIIREFGITTLRFLALLHGRVIPASGEGKIKTLSQMATIILILGFLVLKEGGLEPEGILRVITECGPFVLMSITLSLTLISGINYFWRYKELILSVKE